MLDIVLRTCDNSAVHNERGSRFIDVDKTTLIKKCFMSIAISIQNFKLQDVKLWIIDDHSKKSLLEYFSTVCKNKDIELEIVSMNEKGFNNSAFKQFEYCKEKGREWVYSVEDDYLHFPESIKIMYEAANNFSNKFGRVIAIRPDDDVFTYSPNTKYSQMPCRILLGTERHWRTLNNTHNTFFTHVDVFKNYWELFASLAKYYKVTTVNEDGTINTIWSDGVGKDGPVPLLSPIPTLAVHISQNNEPPFVNYKKLWDEIEL